MSLGIPHRFASLVLTAVMCTLALLSPVAVSITATAHSTTVSAADSAATPVGLRDDGFHW
jgi:hypothetical protein